jgi:glycerol uptake facilitator-like aquaporin
MKKYKLGNLFVDWVIVFMLLIVFTQISDFQSEYVIPCVVGFLVGWIHRSFLVNRFNDKEIDLDQQNKK